MHSSKIASDIVADRDPIVLAGMPTKFADDETVIRVTGVGDTSFEIYADVPNHAVGQGAVCGSCDHAPETFGWMIAESGSFSNGIQIGSVSSGCQGGPLCTPDQGCPSCQFDTGFEWATVNFASPIADPVVLSQIQTHTGDDWVKTRHQSVTPLGFQVRMEEDGLDNGHNTEMFGYFAVPRGVGSTGFLTYEAIVTPNEVTEQPYDISFTAGFTAPPSVFANMATIHGTDPSQMRLTGLPTTMGATMFIEEETCTDAEMTHTWAETVHVLAIEQSTRGCGGRLAMVRGTLAFTCDNGYTAYINGHAAPNVNPHVHGCQEVANAQGHAFTGCDWPTMDEIVFEEYVDHELVIAIDGLDSGGIGAMIGTVTVNGQTYPTNADGLWKCWQGGTHPQDGEWAVTNTAWMSDTLPPEGWQFEDYDDSAWLPAADHGVYGTAPWGARWDDVKTFDTSSHWIWTSDADNHNDVYCRIVIPINAGSACDTQFTGAGAPPANPLPFKDHMQSRVIVPTAVKDLAGGLQMSGFVK
eukprot:COSAG04_NODE_26_length_37184_cov_14.641149_14_plen_525_part_00